MKSVSYRQWMRRIGPEAMRIHARAMEMFPMPWGGHPPRTPEKTRAQRTVALRLWETSVRRGTIVALGPREFRVNLRPAKRP